VRSPPPEKEEAAETTCDQLSVTPIPLKGSEAEPGKKGGVGGRCFKTWFYFSLPYSDLNGDELNFFFSPSSVCFVSDSNW